MPLMSEGKPGPSPSKLRAIWRREVKKRTELIALREQKKLRPGYNPADCLTTANIAIIDGWLAGDPPVGIMRGPWKAICKEMAHLLTPGPPPDAMSAVIPIKQTDANTAA